MDHSRPVQRVPSNSHRVRSSPPTTHRRPRGKLPHPRSRDPYHVEKPDRPFVLVAEDDADMRELLAEALRDDGYDVMEVCEGSQILPRVLFHRSDVGPLANVDLIVTDVRMPGATGLQVLEALRKKDWATSVIVISGFVDDQVRAQARKMGAAAVFSKPFALGEFLHAVHCVAPRCPTAS